MCHMRVLQKDTGTIPVLYRYLRKRGFNIVLGRVLGLVLYAGVGGRIRLGLSVVRWCGREDTSWP
jgi:hypothetical protein